MPLAATRDAGNRANPLWSKFRTEMIQTLDWPIVRRLGKQRYLFLSLILFLLTGPVVGPGDTPIGRIAMYSILTLVVITGPLAASRGIASLIFTFALAFLMLVLGFFSSALDFAKTGLFSNILGILFFGFLSGLLLRNLLFASEKVNAETLWMAVNVYILVGLFFAFLYAAVAFADPQMFVGKITNAPLRDQMYGFVYFSFVTLTTLGYGDITPNNIVVGTLTYMEALIGQLYVAIMIARLVGLYSVRNN